MGKHKNHCVNRSLSYSHHPLRMPFPRRPRGSFGAFASWAAQSVSAQLDSSRRPFPFPRPRCRRLPPLLPVAVEKGKT